MATTAVFGFIEDFSTGFASLTATGNYGSVAIGNGLPGADGSYALEKEAGTDPSGPYTKFGDYSSEFVDGSAARVSVYLDKTWAPTDGFQYTVAVNNTAGTHLQDFGFLVSSNGGGTITIGTAAGSGFTPVGVGSLPAPTAQVTANGWYTLEHVFHNTGGTLTVDMNLINSSGVSTTINTITGPAITGVGGNRYGWFTSIDVPGSGNGATVGNGLAVDNYVLGDFVGRVVEAATSAPNTYIERGAIPFTDVDPETHTVTFAPAASNYIGTFAVSTSNDSVGIGDIDNNRGAVQWSFSVDNSVINSMAQGETRTQTYALNLKGAGDTNSATQNVTVTIVGTNDAPVITSNAGGANASVSIFENSTAVTTVAATDVDNGATLTYSLGGGADAAKFAINSTTGALSFLAAPDYENPTDVGANNVYDVIVRASDGIANTDQAIAVTVLDVNENGGGGGGDTPPPPAGPGPGNDVIVVGAGSGTVSGGGGSDTISAAPQTGEITHIFGGSAVNDPTDGGDQIMVTGSGGGEIYGNGGGDFIDFRASGAGTIYGGLGADRLYAANDANNLVYGGTGDGDSIEVNGAGNNTIYGGSFADDPSDGGDYIAVGGSGRDLIFGNGGNDTIVVNATGAATVDGGVGADRIEVNNNAGNLIFGGTGAGDIIIVTGNGSNTIYGGSTINDPNDGADQISVTSNGNNVIYGNGGDDRIVITGNGANTVYGGVGNDSITGASGNDRLEGSVGVNQYTGGGGADRFVHGFTAQDTITDFSFAQGDRLELGGQAYKLGTGPGGAATLTFADGGSIVLQGVTEAQFSPAFVV